MRMNSSLILPPATRRDFLKSSAAAGGALATAIHFPHVANAAAAGDKIKIVGNPARDGTNVVHWEKLILSDGKVLWESPRLNDIPNSFPITYMVDGKQYIALTVDTRAPNQVPELVAFTLP